MNRKGQAVIEYMLLLVVFVGMFGLAYNRLFKPFQTYFTGVGDYVSCLLEYGELPSFGSSQVQIDQASTAKGKTCKAKFQAGNGGNGSGGSGGSPGGGGAGAGGSDGSDGESGGNGKQSKNQKGKNQNQSDSSDSSGGGGSSGRVYSSSSGLFKTNKRTLQKPLRGADGGTTETTTRSSFRSSSRGGRDPYGLSKPKKIAVAAGFGNYLENKEKNTKKAKIFKDKNISIDEGSISKGGPKKFTIKPQNRAIAAEVEDEGFGISGLMRYFIIAAIVILIFVLVGGQALQMSKNMEK